MKVITELKQYSDSEEVFLCVKIQNSFVIAVLFLCCVYLNA